MFDPLRALKALADETRLRLALVLYRYELSVNELVGLLDMGQSRVSRHLKILTDAGLLQSRRDGLWVFYSAPHSGAGFTFLEAILPLTQGAALPDHDILYTDRERAARIIEERATKTRQFFNAIAEDWDAMNSEVLGSFRLPEAVRQAVPAHCKVAVDLGCGTGEVLEHLLPLCQQVIGVDGSPHMLELARRRFGESGPVSLRIGELDHLPLRDAEADFACINLVLHHLAEPEAGLIEIARVLRPTGRLLVTDFALHRVETMHTLYGDRWLGFDEQKLIASLTQAGFDVESVQRHEIKMGLHLLLVQAQRR